MIFVQPDRRRDAASKPHRSKHLWLAISVVSRHKEIIRAQWWHPSKQGSTECYCQLWVTTGMLRWDKDGHAWRNSYAYGRAALPEKRIVDALQEAFYRAGIEDYEVEDEELALRALAEHMGFMDYILVRQGYAENHSIPGRAKRTYR